MLFLGDLIYSGTLFLHFRDSNFHDYCDSISSLKAFIEKNPGVTLLPSHNQIPLETNFIDRVSKTLELMNHRQLSQSGTWPKDDIFEKGKIFENDDIKIVVKNDTF